MNWGKGITIVMISFITYILFMVFTLISKNTDLESENYYQKEIEFEKEIKALSNTNNLKEVVKVSQNEEYVIIQFPDLNKLDSIQVLFFRPNNKKYDQLFTLQNSKFLTVPLNKLRKGIYDLKIQYKVEDELYFQKESIIIK